MRLTIEVITINDDVILLLTLSSKLYNFNIILTELSHLYLPVYCRAKASYYLVARHRIYLDGELR